MMRIPSFKRVIFVLGCFVVAPPTSYGFVLPTTQSLSPARRDVLLLAAKGVEEAVVREPCNVVLTTTNADFDSLAAACALAELWSSVEPFCEVPTHVVLPRGALPSVARFLSFHKHVLPVRGFKTIDGDDVRAVGVVDASSAERLGRARSWIEKADSVHVFDHHLKTTAEKEHLETVSSEYCVEAVGSTTTMMVERLKEAGLEPAGPAAATLYVLGIRADTGGLAYESTTLRDAEALCWLLKCGASQAAVAEFSLDRVSVEQREALAKALPEVSVTKYRGIQIATVDVVTERYVSGLAQIAEELLALTAADVVLLAARVSSSSDGQSSSSNNNNKRTWIDVIGRARPSAFSVDLREVMAPLGGGGHARAAAASVSLAVGNGEEEQHESSGAEAARRVLKDALTRVQAQIPKEVRADKIMTADVVAVDADSTISDARVALLENDLKSIPVVDTYESKRLKGLLKLSDVVKAEKQRKQDDKVKGWMRTQVNVVSPRATLAEIETVLQNTGRLPVCDDNRVLIGIITRTDVLRIRNYYAHGIKKTSRHAREDDDDDDDAPRAGNNNNDDGAPSSPSKGDKRAAMPNKSSNRKKITRSSSGRSSSSSGGANERRR